MNSNPGFSYQNIIGERLRRIFPNGQSIALALVIIIGFILIFNLSDILMPVFASVILAYLLEGIVGKLEKKYPEFLLFT